jgi:hypothetical protein
MRTALPVWLYYEAGREHPLASTDRLFDKELKNYLKLFLK